MKIVVEHTNDIDTRFGVCIAICGVIGMILGTIGVALTGPLADKRDGTINANPTKGNG